MSCRQITSEHVGYGEVDLSAMEPGLRARQALEPRLLHGGEGFLEEGKHHNWVLKELSWCRKDSRKKEQ